MCMPYRTCIVIWRTDTIDPERVCVCSRLDAACALWNFTTILLLWHMQNLLSLGSSSMTPVHTYTQTHQFNYEAEVARPRDGKRKLRLAKSVAADARERDKCAATATATLAAISMETLVILEFVSSIWPNRRDFLIKRNDFHAQ